MATAASVTVDLTTCPICLEMFDNPKSLPCLHTFCLKCLQGYFKDKCLGDEVPCPMCRKEFEIPDNGLEGLQHHFFVQRLVDVRKVESSAEIDEVPCEVCVEDSDGGSDKITTATTYCVDCNQKLCDQCSKPHRRWKGGAHQVKALGAEVEQELIQLRASSCDKHKDKQVELYCLDCKENICLMCSAVKHRNHNSGEIPEMAHNFRPRMHDDGDKIQSAINTVREQSEQTKQDAVDFRSKVEDMKRKVISIGDEVKRAVDSQVDHLLMELESVTSESAKQAENVQEAYQLALVAMQSFHTYSRELLVKGRPSDITRAACELHDRATELLDSDVTAVKYRPPHVTFTPADVTQMKHLNLIGKVTVACEMQPGEKKVSAGASSRDAQDTSSQQLQQGDTVETFRQKYLSSAASVIKNISTGYTVTSVDDELFVLLRRVNDQVCVYSINDYQQRRHLNVPRYKPDSFSDMTSCVRHKCLYMSDFGSRCIHRYELASSATSKWSVPREPRGLSVTPSGKLLVTCRGPNKLVELNVDSGECVREIALQSDIEYPRHSVQLTTGQFVVSHGFYSDDLHRVCVVGDDGQVTRSYGGQCGSDVGQLNVPRHLAVDKDSQFIFVADGGNERVVLLSPTLEFVRYIEGLSAPRRLYFHQATRRLFVGQYDGGVRVIQL